MAKRFGRNQRRSLYRELKAAEFNYNSLTAAFADHSRKQAKAIDALKAQIADTGAALNAERGSVFRVATGEELWVIPEANVRRYRDTSEYERHEGQQHDIQRTCEVQLIQYAPTEALMEALARRYGARELVSFRGLRWAVQDLRADRPDRSFDVWSPPSFVTFTVRLAAIGKAAK